MVPFVKRGLQLVTLMFACPFFQVGLQLGRSEENDLNLGLDENLGKLHQCAPLCTEYNFVLGVVNEKHNATVILGFFKVRLLMRGATTIIYNYKSFLL